MQFDFCVGMAGAKEGVRQVGRARWRQVRARLSVQMTVALCTPPCPTSHTHTLYCGLSRMYNMHVSSSSRRRRGAPRRCVLEAETTRGVPSRSAWGCSSVVVSVNTWVCEDWQTLFTAGSLSAGFRSFWRRQQVALLPLLDQPVVLLQVEGKHFLAVL